MIHWSDFLILQSRSRRRGGVKSTGVEGESSKRFRPPEIPTFDQNGKVGDKLVYRVSRIRWPMLSRFVA